MYAYKSGTQKIPIVHLWNEDRTYCDASIHGKRNYVITPHRNGKKVCPSCKGIFSNEVRKALFKECQRQLAQALYDRSLQEIINNARYD
jgi:hypothetical protein